MDILYRMSGIFFGGARSLMGMSEGCYDGHAHIFRCDLPLSADHRYVPSADALPDCLSSLLCAHSLDGALLVQPSFLGSDNSYLLDFLSSRPDDALTYRGVIVLDPVFCVDRGWLRSLADLGIIGIRLNLFGIESSFSYSDWRSVFLTVEELGWHIELHCCSSYLGSILPLLVCTQSKIVIDHFGLVSSPDDSGFGVIMSQPSDRVWIKVSAPYRIFSRGEIWEDIELVRPLVEMYSQKFGFDRLVWGSDWPFTQFESRVTYDKVIDFGERLGTATLSPAL